MYLFKVSKTILVDQQFVFDFRNNDFGVIII